MRAVSSRAARRALKAASACGTDSGSMPRALRVGTDVASAHHGTTLVAASPAAPGSSRRPRPRDGDAAGTGTRPRCRGWPSIDVATSSRSASNRQLVAADGQRAGEDKPDTSPRPTTRDRARMRDPVGAHQIGAARLPAGRSNALSIAFATRCRWSRATDSAPSPWTSTRTPGRRTPARRRRRRGVSAAPNASKPGPGLADVAGARTRVGAARKVGQPPERRVTPGQLHGCGDGVGRDLHRLRRAGDRPPGL